mmetsp:Transcript_15007/g.38566  ORF Transcript_15007/g.38566 Transcript_15007/m.38566 type:complete len:308 (+) Transcript_15007:360-1283(+)
MDALVSGVDQEVHQPILDVVGERVVHRGLVDLGAATGVHAQHPIVDGLEQGLLRGACEGQQGRASKLLERGQALSHRLRLVKGLGQARQDHGADPIGRHFAHRALPEGHLHTREAVDRGQENLLGFQDGVDVGSAGISVCQAIHQSLPRGLSSHEELVVEVSSTISLRAGADELVLAPHLDQLASVGGEAADEALDGHAVVVHGAGNDDFDCHPTILQLHLLPRGVGLESIHHATLEGLHELFLVLLQHSLRDVLLLRQVVNAAADFGTDRLQLQLPEGSGHQATTDLRALCNRMHVHSNRTPIALA